MQLLRDPNIYPTDELLESALGGIYPLFQRVIKPLLGDDGVALEWRYYRDGGAWLGKLTQRKKTLLWLSIWERYFKVSLHFTEKTRGGVMELAIDQRIKTEFSESEAAGKLIGLIIDMKKEEQVEDLLKIIEYKKRLK